MFVIGAGMASVSGSLLVHYLRATDPNVFSFAYSINLITGTIIGGLMSVWGGALGAAIIIGLREVLRALSLPLWESVIMGALTVTVLIAFPRGVAGFVSALYDRLAGRSVSQPGGDFGGRADDAAEGRRRAPRWPDAGGGRRLPQLRQPARGRRRFLHRAAGIDHGADRPERRRQDHDVQPDRRRADPRCRLDPPQRRFDRRPARRARSPCAGSPAPSRTCSCSRP